MSERVDGWDGFDRIVESAEGEGAAEEAGELFADFDGLEATEPVPVSGDLDSVDQGGAQAAVADEADQPVRPITGNARVDAATSGLDRLDDLPTPEHADVFDDVHRGLQGALADLDEG